jgi:hypothetical protein
MSSNMVARNKLPYWGGAALMLGSLLFFVNKINEMSRLFLSKWMPDMISGQDMLLIIIGQVALIAGFAAYYLLYAKRAGRIGKIGLLLFCSGGVLLAVGHVAFMPVIPSGLFIFVILGVAAAIIGLILFGVANLRQPVLTRWHWLPLATGLMGFIGFFLFSGAEITAVFLLFRTLFALGLFGLGLVMCLERPIQLEVVR